jgi:translation elongation factor EF-Tu-like GTPase
MKVIEKADIAPLEPLLCSVAAATVLTGRCERSIINAIAKGEIRGVKSDRRTLVDVQSLKEYVAKLPLAKLKIDNRENRRG